MAAAGFVVSINNDKRKGRKQYEPIEIIHCAKLSKKVHDGIEQHDINGICNQDNRVDFFPMIGLGFVGHNELVLVKPKQFCIDNLVFSRYNKELRRGEF